MDFLEWIGAFSGLLGVWLTMRKNILCFPVGLVNVSISAYLFFHSNLYADTLQQAAFAILIVFGWVSWQNESFIQSKPISILSNSSRVVYFILAVFIGVGLGALLNNYTDAHFPYIDAMLTSFCFIGQYLIAKRKVENWHVWIFTNAGYVALYLVKDLNVYAVLYMVYLAMAVWGLKRWQTELRNG
ncbi:MAG: nicotinamide riboside transporter PnuC [Bacteroidota bacterium]